MSKHTPGPWRYCGQEREQCPCGQVWSVASDFQVATVHLLNEENDTEIDRDQQKANTRLIAAAPDLLEYAEMDLIFENTGSFLMNGNTYSGKEGQIVLRDLRSKAIKKTIPA